MGENAFPIYSPSPTLATEPDMVCVLGAFFIPRMGLIGLISCIICTANGYTVIY